MEKTIESMSGWECHQVMNKRCSLHEMVWAEDGIDKYLGTRILTSVDDGSIEAYNRLSRQRLMLVSFEGRPYAVETKQKVWGETDSESDFTINVYSTEREKPRKFADELIKVVEDTIKSKRESLGRRIIT